jgi:hypothetical protein
MNHNSSLADIVVYFIHWMFSNRSPLGKRRPKEKLHDSQGYETVKYGYESRGTQNQE